MREQNIRSRGFLVWTETSLKEVGRHEKRPIARSVINISSARNEYESFQVVVAPSKSKEPLRNLELEFTDLFSKRWKIGKEKITCYVIGHTSRKSTSKSDPLFPYNSFWSIMLRQKVVDTQPFWITIYTPPNAKAGSYSGKIKVSTRNAGVSFLKLNLRVWNFCLKDVMHLKTHFKMKYDELRNLHMKVPEKAFEDVLFRYHTNAAEHRTYFQGIIASPYLAGSGGRICSCYENFDRDMHLLVGLGMNLYCIHPEDWGHRLSQRASLSLLGKLEDHLREMGWLDIAYLHLDKGLSFHSTLNQIKAARFSSPKIKVVADLTRKRRLSRFVDAAILRYDHKCFTKIHEWMTFKSRAIGEIWIDVACKPRAHGALCILHHLIDRRRFFWEMWSKGVRGLVYDSVLPTNSSFEPLLYPMENGPMNSIRWENVRDGIEDYEYLCLLEERINALEKDAKDFTISRPMKKIYLKGRRLLSSIRKKKSEVDIIRYRERVAILLEKFSKA
ncbi:MAG: glycoside hydrolase domain-containing protein [Thermoproteota archaeon]